MCISILFCSCETSETVMPLGSWWHFWDDQPERSSHFRHCLQLPFLWNYGQISLDSGHQSLFFLVDKNQNLPLAVRFPNCLSKAYIYIQRVFSLAFNWCCNGLGHQIRRRTKPIEENIWITWRSARKWRVAGIGLLLKIWLVCMLVVGWIKLVCPSTMHVLSGLRCSVVENPRNPRTWGSSSTAIDRTFRPNAVLRALFSTSRRRVQSQLQSSGVNTISHTDTFFTTQWIS